MYLGDERMVAMKRVGRSLREIEFGRLLDAAGRTTKPTQSFRSRRGRKGTRAQGHKQGGEDGRGHIHIRGSTQVARCHGCCCCGEESFFHTGHWSLVTGTSI